MSKNFADLTPDSSEQVEAEPKLFLYFFPKAFKCMNNQYMYIENKTQMGDTKEASFYYGTKKNIWHFIEAKTVNIQGKK